VFGSLFSKRSPAFLLRLFVLFSVLPHAPPQFQRITFSFDQQPVIFPPAHPPSKSLFVSPPAAHHEEPPQALITFPDTLSPG
jgi:hypothetical protein